MMSSGMAHDWLADRTHSAVPEQHTIFGNRTGISAGNRIGIKNEIRNKGAYQS